MINGFDPARPMLRDGGLLDFGGYKIFKDAAHDTKWIAVLYDFSGDVIESVTRRSYEGCMAWVNKKERYYANGLVYRA